MLRSGAVHEAKDGLMPSGVHESNEEACCGAGAWKGFPAKAPSWASTRLQTTKSWAGPLRETERAGPARAWNPSAPVAPKRLERNLEYLTTSPQSTLDRGRGEDFRRRLVKTFPSTLTGDPKMNSFDWISTDLPLSGRRVAVRNRLPVGRLPEK